MASSGWADEMIRWAGMVGQMKEVRPGVPGVESSVRPRLKTIHRPALLLESAGLCAKESSSMRWRPIVPVAMVALVGFTTVTLAQEPVPPPSTPAPAPAPVNPTMSAPGEKKLEDRKELKGKKKRKKYRRSRPTSPPHDRAVP